MRNPLLALPLSLPLSLSFHYIYATDSRRRSQSSIHLPRLHTPYFCQANTKPSIALRHHPFLLHPTSKAHSQSNRKFFLLRDNWKEVTGLNSSHDFPPEIHQNSGTGSYTTVFTVGTSISSAAACTFQCSVSDHVLTNDVRLERRAGARQQLPSHEQLPRRSHGGSRLATIAGT